MWIPTLGLDCIKCSDSQKILYGCEVPTEEPWWDVGGTKLNRCPLKVVKNDVHECFNAYNKYEKGFLPNEGGWQEQPANFNAVINIISEQKLLIEKKKVK